MKICSKCGYELKAEAMFCERCGIPVELEVPRYCAHCGARVDRSHNFCSVCGRSILIQKDEKYQLPFPGNVGSGSSPDVINTLDTAAASGHESGAEQLSIMANLYCGLEAVGGKLTITNKGIIFKSHNLNFQTGTIIIPFIEIAEVFPKNFGGIVPTGMCIRTLQGLEYSFAIYSRTKIIALINSLRST